MLAPKIDPTEQPLAKFSCEADRTDLMAFLIRSRLLEADQKHNPDAVHAALTKHFNRVLYRPESVQKDRMGRSTTRGAERHRRLKARRKNGRKCFEIEADEIGLIDALQRNGFLQTTDPDHFAVVVGLERVVALWIEDQS
jgi:hypothetical protein